MAFLRKVEEEWMEWKLLEVPYSQAELTILARMGKNMVHAAHPDKRKHKGEKEEPENK